MIRRTDDPEMIVADYDFHGRVGSTGRTFRAANVVIARVRDGLIVSSHAYHRHVAVAEALGRLPELVGALPTA